MRDILALALVRAELCRVYAAEPPRCGDEAAGRELRWLRRDRAAGAAGSDAPDGASREKAAPPPD